MLLPSLVRWFNASFSQAPMSPRGQASDEADRVCSPSQVYLSAGARAPLSAQPCRWPALRVVSDDIDGWLIHFSFQMNRNYT